MHHLTILTGASRGMGLAMARQLCESAGARLLCISRGRSEPLDAHAKACGAELTQWRADLADPAGTGRRLREWLAAQDARTLASATLINNAAVVGRIGPMVPADAAGIATAMRLNLEAPMLLTASFLEATQGWTLPRKVLNISSGLGRRAMAGAALYCAAKAGLDHFSRSVALDEARHAQGARIVSLAPGVIDTDMQGELRAAGMQAAAGDFPEHANFVRLKESRSLSSPEEAARRVLAWLARPDFGANVVADVREAD